MRDGKPTLLFLSDYYIIFFVVGLLQIALRAGAIVNIVICRSERSFCSPCAKH